MDEIDRRRLEVAERWERSLQQREDEVARREALLIECGEQLARRANEWATAAEGYVRDVASLRGQFSGLSTQLSAFEKRLDELEARLIAHSTR